jgi:hypothetical protein
MNERYTHSYYAMQVQMCELNTQGVTETRYSPLEKLCLCLYFSCTKLWHYLLSAECTVVSKADVIKHMLSMLILHGGVENGFWHCLNLT